MDIKQIKKLIDVVRQNGVAELEVKEDNESIHIVLNKETPLPASSGGGQGVFTAQASASSAVDATQFVEDRKAGHDDRSAGFAVEDVVTSPMVGTVYLSSGPDSDVFVHIGDTVQAGDTLCLIEAMKMFNRIEATKGGTVTHVLVQDAQSVEYGQQLFVIE